MLKEDFIQTFIYGTVEIQAGQTTSNFLDCGGGQPRAIYLPSNFISGNLTFNSKLPTNNSQVYLLVDVDGSNFSIPATLSKQIPLLPYIFDAIPMLQIVSSSTQTQKVTIVVGMQPLYQGIHA